MKCIYCDRNISSREKSREHVVPQWILKYLNAEKEKINLVPISESLFVHKARSPTTNTLTHTICSKCNNEWLSEIDRSCMPLVKYLATEIVITRSQIIEKFQIEDIDKLKILIYKIFLNLFATSPFRDKKKKFYNEFYRTKSVPPGTNLFVSHIIESHERKIALSHLDGWNDNELPSSDEKMDTPNIRFKFFIQIGKIAFVMYNTGINIKPVGIDPRFLSPLHTSVPYIFCNIGLEPPFPPVGDSISNRLLYSLKTNFSE